MSLSVLSDIDQLTLIRWIIAIHQGELAGNPTAFYPPELNAYAQINTYPATGGMPAWFFASNPDQIVICIEGLYSFGQAKDFFGGAVIGTRPYKGVGLNSNLIGPAAQIANQLTPVKFSSARPLVIAGHSYGGALAQAVAVALSDSNYPQPFQVLTFGSPRAGDTSLSAFMDKQTLVRLMNIADPIPFFPPHFDEAPYGTIAIGYPAAANLAQFVQAGGGLVLDQLGNETAATLPPNMSPITDLNLVTWLIGANGYASDEHRDTTYMNRLTRSIQLAPPLPPFNPSGAGIKGEIEPALTLPTFNLGPVLGPLAMQEVAAMQSVYIPPAYKFKVVKVGNLYQVVWMNLTILTGQTKSNAKTFAKAGNKLLRVMQTVQSVQHTPFGNALQAYLTVASSTTSGFQPPLTVT